MDATHPGLRGRVDDGISVADPGDSGIALPFWHATAIAGLIVGQGPGNLDVGAAPGARVLPIDVIGTDRRLSFGRTVAGVITAVDAGADVITMSLGNSCEFVANCPGAIAGLPAAIDYAWNRDVVVIVSGGNDGAGEGRDEGDCDRPANQVRYPASLAQVVAVGGTTRSGDRWECSPDQPYIHVLAPAQDILSYAPVASDTTFTLDSGTSFAAPLVAGLAARLLSIAPGLPVEVLHGMLTTFTTEIGQPDVARLIAATQQLAAATSPGSTPTTSPERPPLRTRPPSCSTTSP